eukprot:2020356-Amphidinium_carterae.1
MVGVVLWAARALSLPLSGRQGEQLFGGHSWRVSGARFFASRGVDLATIIVIAWASQLDHLWK